MDVKKGGVVQKVFLGKLMEKIGLNKGNKQVSATRHDPLDATGQDYKRMRPEPTHQQMVDVFKDKFARKKKGGVMEKGKPHSTKEGRQTQKAYKLARILANKDRMSTRDIERAKKLAKSFGSGITDSAPKVIDKMLKTIQKDKSIVGKKTREPTAMEKGKAKAKEHKEKLKKLGRKAVGYVKGWVGKKKGGKVKRGCANGGTVVMPTVGNDVRVRAYKQGALIHPRPRPTTVLHGRPRGVGIAKRGW